MTQTIVGDKLEEEVKIEDQGKVKQVINVTRIIHQFVIIFSQI